MKRQKLNSLITKEMRNTTKVLPLKKASSPILLNMDSLKTFKTLLFTEN